VVGGSENIDYLTGAFATTTERSLWLFVPASGDPAIFYPGLDRDLWNAWWVPHREWYFDFHHHGDYNKVVWQAGPRADLPSRDAGKEPELLVDKTVLVTGASSGIGAACAQAFAAQGARLLLCARRRDRLASLASSLDGEVHTFELDVRDRDAVHAAVARLPEPWRQIDVLVNNAGLAAGF
jgi:Xaa-Pro aminopeptidase